jgi:hypothetical protein
MKVTAVLFPGVDGVVASAEAQPAPELEGAPAGKRMYQEHMAVLLRDQYFPPAELLPGIAPKAARALVRRMRAVPAGAQPMVRCGRCPCRSLGLQLYNGSRATPRSCLRV